MTKRDAVWAERVAAWKASGMGAVRFCEGKGYSSSSLAAWSRRLRTSDASSAPSVRLAAVVRQAAPAACGAGGITVERGALRVHFAHDCDRQWALTILRELSA